MSEYLVDRLAADGDDFDSSNIDLLGYDANNETLYVEFHSSPDVYAYSGVKESTYDMLISADSVGSFYARHIKGNYDGENVGDGVIELREDDPIQPDRKWLTTDGEESPFVAEGEADAISISGGGIFAASSINVPVITPSRYVVQWTSDDFNGAGPFKPEFQAMSEADALAQFNAAVSQVMPDAEVKIQAVTRYLD